MTRKINSPLNVLVLYDPKSVFVSTIKEYLSAFAKYSEHSIHYVPATNDYCFDVQLEQYDVVVINYSLRVSVVTGNYTISSLMARKLAAYTGLKVLFMQDEYETTNVAINWIKQLGIQLVYTCVPEEYLEDVYAELLADNVQFIQTLTGYVPEGLQSFPATPLADRELDIAYRGRNLPYWYGELGQEKEMIGIKMKEYAQHFHLKTDIEWTEEKRIYGDGWYDFLASAKATLGTESGSNLFDFTGEISKQITEYLHAQPSATYAEVHEKFLKPYDGKIRMNQISPKIFEAICLKTALILFEGSYSGVVEPDKHFIPLKKDFSNIDEVIKKLKDESYLESLVQRAYSDIIKSGNYSYQYFMQEFDQSLIEHIHSSSTHQENSCQPSSTIIHTNKTTGIKYYLPNKYPLSAEELGTCESGDSGSVINKCKACLMRVLTGNVARKGYQFINKNVFFMRPILGRVVKLISGLQK